MGFADRGYYRSSDRFRPEWTAVITLIVANVAIWVGNLLGGSQFSVNNLFALRGDLPNHLLDVWQLFTYGFAHDARNPWHLAFNMLAVWFFGWPVEDILGRAEFYRFYISSVVIAGLAWVVSVNLAGPGAAAHTFLIGASGGVMAVLAVFVWYFPRQEVLIWGVLPVPAWALGILYFVSDVQGATAGGGNVAHVAHIGGAIFGLLYAWRGWNLGGLSDLGGRLGQMRRRLRVVRPEDETPGQPGSDEEDDTSLQAKVDRILTKISRSGESSLTREERDTLTRASQRLRHRQR